MIATEEPTATGEEATPRVYGPDPIVVGWRVLSDTAEPRKRKGSRAGRAHSAIGGGILAVIVTVLFLVGGILRAPRVATPVDWEYGREAAAGKSLVEDVKRAVAGYFGARSIEERLAFVCDPDRVRPLMDDHYGSRSLVAREVVRVEVHATMTRFTTRRPYLFASVIDAGNEISVAILRQDDAGVKIDWEAQEAYNPLDITNVIRLHPSGDTELRVMARPSNYYNFEFGDAGEWQAFVLWNPNEAKAKLHGYCRKGSAVCGVLLDLTAGGHAVAAPITVGFSPDLNGDNTVEIREIVAPHWFGGDA